MLFFTDWDLLISGFYNDLLAPVVQRLDNTIHRINHCPLDIAIGFAITYPVDSDLSGGWRYPSFEQLGPAL